MQTPKGQIDRTGCVNFGDASISIWEEGIASARAAGGFEGAQKWEREFKRDVFKRMAQTMRKLGWQVGPLDYIFTGNDNRHCQKGELHADLKLSGRTIVLAFFQNVNAPDRADHGGRYQSNQEKHMPYLMRLEMERARRRIRAYLLNVFTGYTFKEPEKKLGAHAGGLTAVEWVEQHYRSSCHFKPALGRPGGDDLSYNNGSAEKSRVVHGQRVWFADRAGRIHAGTAMYNINNMWWVITGRYTVRNIASFEIYTKCPDQLRIKRNASLCRSRLEKEMAKAVGSMSFERAAKLRDILFPGAPAIFNVWHSEHQLYHCSGFSGYTSDQSKAGKFTADEVRSWDSAPNVVRAIAMQKAA